MLITITPQDDKPNANAAADGDKTDDKPSKPEEEKKSSEPSSETLTNMVRVTPAQMAYVTFPSIGRYQPVRPIASLSASLLAPSTGIKKGKRVAPPTVEAGKGKSNVSLPGGGIIMLRDSQPGVEGEYIELTSSLDAAPRAPEEAPAPAAHAEMQVDEGPELEMPAPFQVSPGPFYLFPDGVADR
jgi:26S proteasome regulatory subunit N2